MKKLFVTALSLALALALAACGGGQGQAPQSASAPASRPASEASSEPSGEGAGGGLTLEDFDPDFYRNATFVFNVPEDFEQVEATGGAAEAYAAEDGSSVTVTIVEDLAGSTTFDATEESLVSSLEAAFTQALGTETALRDVSFAYIDVGGCPGYRLDYTLDANGVAMRQTSVGVTGAMGYTFGYTDLSGGWADAFNDSIASITPVQG